MIHINNSSFDISEISADYPENSVKDMILQKLASSPDVYNYENVNQLKFEIDLRNEIINSAESLNKSGLSFAVFKKTKSNPEYWKTTDNGGFSLAENVKPSAAINDIFTNGDKYATECSTAMTIIYYKALLNIYKDDLFDKTFPDIYLMDWDVREPLLTDIKAMQKTEELLPGDRGYFSNPDFNPNNPEWQGENVIVLPDSMYYGHGIGIAKADEIVNTLNTLRKDKSTTSARLLSSAGRPNFKKLSDVYFGLKPRFESLVWKPFPVASMFV